MSAFALALVLCAAFLHATWNFLLKRAGGGVAFVWLFAALSVGIYAPLALGVVLWQRPQIGWPQLAFIFGSAVLHTAYYLLLARGYRGGDLSLVYPLARGTGPLLATFGAVLLLGERPGIVALAGAVLIGVGVFLLTADPRRLRMSGNRGAVGYALLTGTTIAGYTLWDKQAVSAFLVPPLLLDWGANLARVGLMSPLALRDRAAIAREWQEHRSEAIWVAVLCPLSYILVLTAMVFTPVSYVAPAREVSILIAAAMGAHLLAEGHSIRRGLAACAMVAGVVALAVG